MTDKKQTDDALVAFRQQIQELQVQPDVPETEKVIAFSSALTAVAFGVAEAHPDSADDLIISRELERLLAVLVMYKELRLKSEVDNQPPSEQQQTDS